MKIIEATIEDIPVIYDLANRIWKVHYPAIISREQIDYMLEKMYSKAALEEQLNTGHRFFILTTDEHPAGYLSYSHNGDGAYFLHKLYVDTGYHQKGMGRYLLNEVFDKIPTIKTLRLTVNRKNYTAINFYFKMGFIIEEVKDFDIGNGYEMNDFVMLKNYTS